MEHWEELICRVLGHPIRRLVIETLSERSELSFNELSRAINISNHGKLGFHVRSLGEFVERDPSKGTFHLTDLGKLSAELIQHLHISAERLRRNLEVDPRRYVRHLRAGDHAILFYDTEDARREIILSYFEGGLLREEAVFYCSPEDKLDSVNTELERLMTEPARFRKGAITVVSGRKWLLEMGKGKIETIIANWHALADEKLEAGFAGLCIAGQTSFLLDHGVSQMVLDYEAMLGTHLDLNASAICIYKASRLNEEQFVQLMRSHSHAIFKGLAMKLA